MAVQKKPKKAGEGHAFVVTGAELLFIEWHMPSGEILKLTIDAGRTGVDGKEFFAVDGVFDRDTEVTFNRHMPQAFNVIGRLPKTK